MAGSPDSIRAVRADALQGGEVLVRVTTGRDVVGIGAFRASPRVGVAIIEEILGPACIGSSATAPGVVWDRLYYRHCRNGQYIQALAALDMAVWDAFGKTVERPNYDLWGGAARTTVPLYWSQGLGSQKTPAEMLADVRRGYAMGFRAFKIRMDWGPEILDVDPAQDLERFRVCREFLPEQVPLSFDCNWGYSVGTAIRQGHQLEEMGAFHYEEPLPHYNLPGYRQVADALAIPVSCGELEATRWRFRDILAIANPDILQPDILNCGGPSEARRIYELAASFSKPVMPHSPAIGIRSFASLHLFATGLANTLPHEFSDEELADRNLDQAQELYNEPVLPTAGTLVLSPEPGFGLTLNERVLQHRVLRG
jgi:L-alanine-DL-glutamate epimerase-like enolase superfamily enzyme